MLLAKPYPPPLSRAVGPEPRRPNSLKLRRLACVRYRPLLVRGKKFDLRLYALVTSSTAPFTLYLFDEGFCKFCVQPFDLDVRTRQDGTAQTLGVSAACPVSSGHLFSLSTSFFLSLLSPSH